MVRKLFLAALVGFSLFFTTPVLAQSGENMVPEFNPLCWKKKDCASARTTAGFSSTNIDSFFFPQTPCLGGDEDNPWGKCLAGSKTKTAIAFGDVRDFTDIGDFIVKNYNFAIVVVAILAVIVIIMSGFQWTMSAGNSEVITAAKKRIGNALIGLVIAYGSYFILYTINPNLVQFEALKVWMVRPVQDIPKFCYQINVEDADKNTDMFYEAAPGNNQGALPKAPASISWNLSYNALVSGGTENCGARYYFNKGGSATCYGAYCGSGEACMNLDISNPNNKEYHCESGSVYGRVTANYLIPPICVVGVTMISGYESPFISDESTNSIYAICYDHTIEENYRATKVSGAPAIQVSSLDDNTDLFIMGSVSLQPTHDCENGAVFMGYALGLDLNANCSWVDVTHMIDKFGRDLGIWNAGRIKDRSETNGPISESALFTSQELNSGYYVNIDVSNFKLQ